MESINNMASAAAKAVWGENNQNKEEPVSGVKGNTAKGEPYDAGNMDPPKEAQKPTGPADPSAAQPSADPAAPAGGATGDSTKMQNDTRDPTQHTTAAGSSGDAAKDVNTTGAGPVSEPKPEKIEGPGPKPIAEVAKEHGGDAGNCNSSKSSIEKEEDSSSSSSSSEDEGEMGKEEKEEAKQRREQRKKEKKGTGEIYIKSSGLKADGGDFDASRAGAGREADRLMAQKGIHNPTDPEPAPEDGTTEKGKRSLGDKIKEKLHPTIKPTS